MSRYTPVRITITFCSGILLSILTSADLFFHAIIGTGIFYAFFLLAKVVFRTDYAKRWIPGALGLIALFSAGTVLTETKDHQNRRQDLVISDIRSGPLKIFVMEEKPILKSRNYYGKATLVGIIDSAGNKVDANAGVVLYLAVGPGAEALKPGSMLLARCDIAPVRDPANPGGFNFRKYLYYQNIRWQAFLDSSNWSALNPGSKRIIKSWAEENRSRFREVMAMYHIRGDELALASALILGSRDLLDREMTQEFSNAGAIHVLSVSGLHVGIMYVLADRLLFLLKRGRTSRKVHHFIIIGIIWAYAFLTGLPPSVVRASLMFSLITLSQLLNRHQEGINILAGAFLIQLWINPYELTQLGLQLSYVAVLGIFAFYRPINQLFADSQSYVSWTWSVVAVSIAAQLATFPLSSYYFNFFPSYFLITNLIVVPLAAIVVYLALVVLVAGLFEIPLTWLGYPLSWSLRLMHESVSLIQSLPGAVLKPVVVSDFQVILLYMAIAGIFIFFLMKNRLGAWITLSALCVFGLNGNIRSYHRLSRHSITVYSIRNHSAIDLSTGSRAYFIADSALITSPEKIRMQIEPNRNRLGIRSVSIVTPPEIPEFRNDYLFHRYPFLEFCGKTIVTIDQNWPGNDRNSQVLADLAVVSGRKTPDPSKVLAGLHLSRLIIDGSVPEYRAVYWRTACKELHIPCYEVLLEGAYQLTW